jgi:hypothetical protein
MAVRDLEVSWNLFRAPGGEAQASESSIQVTAPSRQEAPEFLATLVIQGSSSEPVVCVPENPFVSLSDVASRVLPFGVRHLAGSFLLPAGSVKGLRVLFEELECESLEITFGDEESIDKLKAAVRAPRWWRLAGEQRRTAHGTGLKCLMSYSPSHCSLEVVGERSLILRLFECVRTAESVVPGRPTTPRDPDREK